MRDLCDILDAFSRLRDGGESAVLASVVHTEGSTYRRPGARALIRPSEAGAEVVGLVSGGCLESDLVAKARAVRDSGAPQRVHYDSRSDDDLVFGLGLGCRGVVDVLLEPVGPDRPGPLAFLERCLRERAAGVLATVTGEAGSGPARASGAGAAPLAAFWAFDAAGRPVSAPGAADAPPPGAAGTARAVLEDGRPRRKAIDGAEVCFVPVARRLRLWVVGAGPDAPPLVALAHDQGWEVVVIDPRAAYARPEHLPGADHIVVSEPGQAPASTDLAPDADTVAMVMTHHYARDREALRWLLPSDVAYVGLLGPAARAQELMDELRAGGLALDPEQLEKLYAPAGLDLGGEGPHAIAVSVVAEIEAVRAGHPGGPLRERKAPIHEAGA